MIATGAVATATIVRGPLGGLAPANAAVLGGLLPGDLALSRFSPYVGQQFTIQVNLLHTEKATLVEATPRQPRPADRPGLQGEAFSLIFAGGGAKAFDNGTFTLSHPAMGTVTLFLVPVGRAQQAQHYQAVIDRRTPAP